MNPTVIVAVAADRNQNMRDQAAKVRLVREARRWRRSQRARDQRPRTGLVAEPAMNCVPAVSAR